MTWLHYQIVLDDRQIVLADILDDWTSDSSFLGRIRDDVPKFIMIVQDDILSSGMIRTNFFWSSQIVLADWASIALIIQDDIIIVLDDNVGNLH